MAIRVGLMGFGRIGRNILRQVRENEAVDVVAISDLGDPDAMAYLLRYDTIYGRFPGTVTLDGKYLRADRQRARLLRGGQPGDMPWDLLGVDVVVEGTHAFRRREELQGHIDAGAGRVILTTPAKDSIDRTIVHGLNERHLRPEDRILSCASATTHALALTLAVLHENFGVECAMMTSVHAYTSDQKLSDAVATNLRRSRSAAENLIPNGSWAPMVAQELLPDLRGKITGIAINVPVPNGSNVDVTTWLRSPADVERVNAAFREAAGGTRSRYIECATDPLVSCDVVGNARSAVFDSLATMAMDNGLVKTVTWYDNGWGYAARVVDLIETLPALETAAVEAGR